MEISEKNEKSYTNGEITVYWKPNLCVHAGICFTDLPEVFRPEKQPWVDINGAPTDKIIKTVNDCPTGALSFSYNNEIKNSIPQAPPLVKIKKTKNGPYLIKGEIELTNEDGEIIKTPKNISLCACGKSKKKPFCDGSHLSGSLIDKIFK